MLWGSKLLLTALIFSYSPFLISFTIKLPQSIKVISSTKIDLASVRFIDMLSKSGHLTSRIFLVYWFGIMGTKVSSRSLLYKNRTHYVETASMFGTYGLMIFLIIVHDLSHFIRLKFSDTL